MTPPSRTRLLASFWALAVLLGLCNTISSGHGIRDGALSYVDMADAFSRGDWSQVVNGQWSPLYPALVGAGFRLLRPSPYWEFAAVHLIDFFLYLGALACFHFFLVQFLRARRCGDGETSFPEWAWLVLGYALFLWSSLGLIMRPPAGTPDICVAACVYLAGGILLRIRAEATGGGWFALLGMVLGLGYLAKAAMFIMAFVFLAAAWLAAGDVRRAAPRLLLALLVFFCVAGPFAAALSRKYGRPMFSDAGRLAYAWLVNGVTPFVHWQGDPPGSGTPLHPTRKIFDKPAVYEFRTPIRATYPPFFDPSYWHEGLQVRFYPANQFRALMANAKIYFNSFLRQGGLIAGFLTLCLLSRRRWLILRDLAGQWTLLLPALATLVLYGLVYVEWRYIGPYLVLLWLGLFAAPRLRDSEESRRLAASLAVAIAFVLLMEIAGLEVHELYYRARASAGHPQAQVAAELHRLGVQPGDPVAVLRAQSEPLWARVARVRVVAEISATELDFFWAGSDALRSSVLDALRSSGAKIAVAEGVPPYASPLGWTKLGATGYYTYLLAKP